MNFGVIRRDRFYGVDHVTDVILDFTPQKKSHHMTSRSLRKIKNIICLFLNYLYSVPTGEGTEIDKLAVIKSTKRGWGPSITPPQKKKFK